MGVSVRAKVDGISDLLAKTAELDKKLRRKTMRSAGDAAGQTFLVAARGKVRVRFGYLRKALKKKTKVYKSGLVVTSLVGIDKGYVGADGSRPKNYAHLVELGTKHSKAFPFLRPSYDEKRQEAARKMGEILKRGIEEAVGK